MRLDRRADGIRQVVDKLAAVREELSDQVLARTVNRTVEQGRTAMSREIRAEFNISAAKVGEKLHVTRAQRTGPAAFEAVLYSSSAGGRRAINIIAFGARQTRRGVTVRVLRTGGRELLPGAFIANEGRTVFRREGKARLPIKPVQVIDVPQMFNTRRVHRRVRDFIEARLPEVFEREAAFALRRLVG